MIDPAKRGRDRRGTTTEEEEKVCCLYEGKEGAPCVFQLKERGKRKRGKETAPIFLFCLSVRPEKRQKCNEAEGMWAEPALLINRGSFSFNWPLTMIGC